jgi:antitoxin component YwqK of YwqJK toxin-antitoxin module
MYYKSGSVQNETFYVDDKRKGTMNIYFESGEIKGIWPFKDGMVEGVALYYL